MNIPLHKSDGAELEFALCFYCQTILPDDPKFRVTARTSLGRRNFCPQGELQTEKTCLHQFRQRFR
jgi:hypothetical protein